MWGPIPTDWESAKTLLHHLALPAITFAITYAGEYQLIMRSSLTGVMNEDFVLTARAKGLSDTNVLWRHVTPNAMLPTVTLVMMNLGFVMTGAILAETIFNWPGLGLLSYDSMNNRDYPVHAGGLPAGERRRDRRQLDGRHHVLLPRPKGEGMIPARLKRWILIWTPVVWLCLTLVTYPRDDRRQRRHRGHAQGLLRRHGRPTMPPGCRSCSPTAAWSPAPACCFPSRSRAR